MLMAALVAVSVTGVLHAAPIPSTQDNNVTTKGGFVCTDVDMIVKDGDEVIQIMDSLSEDYQYARGGVIRMLLFK